MTKQRGIGERPLVEVQPIHCEVPVAIWRNMKVLAAQRGTSLTEEVRRACEELLGREAQKT